MRLSTLGQSLGEVELSLGIVRIEFMGLQQARRGQIPPVQLALQIPQRTVEHRREWLQSHCLFQKRRRLLDVAFATRDEPQVKQRRRQKPKSLDFSAKLQIAFPEFLAAAQVSRSSKRKRRRLNLLKPNRKPNRKSGQSRKPGRIDRRRKSTLE